MTDIGLTHVALPVSNLERSIAFYSLYAKMQVVHQRIDGEQSSPVAWLSDGTRPFVIVLIQRLSIHSVLSAPAHLGVGCKSQEEVDSLCDRAAREGLLVQEPKDSGYPVGYLGLLRDPDGHILELSYGQEIGLTVEGREK